MVVDESANRPLWVRRSRKAIPQPGKNRRKSMFLDEVQQPVFRAKVVIHSGKRHTGSARHIAHRSPGITFFAENFSGMFQYLAQLPIEARLSRCMPQPVSARSGR